MARHKRSAHEEKKKSAEFCSLCSLAFKGERSVELLSSHMAVDHKEDTFCGPCKKQFEDREKLAKHVRLWHTQYSCVYCGASCVGRLGLGKHISAVHMAGDYSCLICGRRRCPPPPHAARRRGRWTSEGTRTSRTTTTTTPPDRRDGGGRRRRHRRPRPRPPR